MLDLNIFIFLCKSDILVRYLPFLGWLPLRFKETNLKFAEAMSIFLNLEFLIPSFFE